MAKDVKIVKSKTAPVDKNVLWDDGKNLKINRNGKWENATSEIKEGSSSLNKSKFQLYKENGGRFFTDENIYNIFDALKNECSEYYWDLEILVPLESGNTYTFDDLDLTYWNFIGVIYGNRSAAVMINDGDGITLFNPGEPTDEYLYFESDIAQLNVNLVTKTVEFNTWE